MESGFDDQMFNEFSPGPLSPLGPKAIQHHPHHHHYNMPHHHQTIMIGGSSGDIIQQQRLPDVHNILPGGSPKMEHYKPLDYGSGNSKIEYKLDSSPYSPTKIEYLNGSGKLEQYSPSSGKQLEYTTVTSNSQYSPNGKIIEYTSSGSNNKMDYEHIQMFQQPQPIDNNSQQQQTLLVNGLNNNNNNNFKRKSEENLNSGSSTPTTTTATTSASPTESSGNNGNKKPNDKKKSDPNGVKKKKTRYFCSLSFLLYFISLFLLIETENKTLICLNDIIYFKVVSCN